MRKTVDLEAGRIARLASELLPGFRDRGSLVERVADVEDVGRWRAAARRAGHDLGWRVRTGISDDRSTLWAISDDYEPSPEARRRANEVLSQLLLRRDD